MSKVIAFLFFFVVALIVLGVLGTNLVYMYRDMEQLKVENQTLSYQLGELRTQYQNLVLERDTAVAESVNLRDQLNVLQSAYASENQARLQAESDAATYQNMVFNMSKNVQVASPLACLPAEQQTTAQGELLLSNVAPIGAGSFISLAVAGLLLAMINHARKQRKLRSLPARIRQLR
jgi:hypothetical protein